MDLTQLTPILAEALKKSVKSFFSVMCPMEVTQGEVMVYKEPVAVPGTFDVIGVIAVSKDIKGSISIHVHRVLGEKVAQNLLGLKEVGDNDLSDTVGELANIIVGAAKTNAASSHLSFDISCPTVIRGGGVSVAPSSHSHVTQIHFKVGGDDVLVMASLHPGG